MLCGDDVMVIRSLIASISISMSTYETAWRHDSAQKPIDVDMGKCRPMDRYVRVQ